MPARSQAITMLPAHLRSEIERPVFQNGFRDYEGLAKWVREDWWRCGATNRIRLTETVMPDEIVQPSQMHFNPAKPISTRLSPPHRTSPHLTAVNVVMWTRLRGL